MNNYNDELKVKDNHTRS